MAKLHEVIAVSDGLQATAKKINEETVTTFKKRDEHFVAHTKAIRHFAEEDTKLDVDEAKEMVTTVMDRLLYGTGANVKAYDVDLEQAATNQVARADLVIDDKVIATGLPGVFLLGMEQKLAELRTIYEQIPTLAPGPEWKVDTDKRKTGGVWKSEHPDVTFRTRKTVKPIVLAPATKEHPAQVNAISEDTPIAKITTHHWSGMLSSAQKADLLARIDKLIRAVKRARQRANNTEVVKSKIGADLFKYIHEGIIT